MHASFRDDLQSFVGYYDKVKGVHGRCTDGQKGVSFVAANCTTIGNRINDTYATKSCIVIENAINEADDNASKCNSIGTVLLEDISSDSDKGYLSEEQEQEQEEEEEQEQEQEEQEEQEEEDQEEQEQEEALRCMNQASFVVSKEWESRESLTGCLPGTGEPIRSDMRIMPYEEEQDTSDNFHSRNASVSSGCSGSSARSAGHSRERVISASAGHYIANEQPIPRTRTVSAASSTVSTPHADSTCSPFPISQSSPSSNTPFRWSRWKLALFEEGEMEEGARPARTRSVLQQRIDTEIDRDDVFQKASRHRAVSLPDISNLVDKRSGPIEWSAQPAHLLNSSTQNIQLGRENKERGSAWTKFKTSVASSINQIGSLWSLNEPEDSSSSDEDVTLIQDKFRRRCVSSASSRQNVVNVSHANNVQRKRSESFSGTEDPKYNWQDFNSFNFGSSLTPEGDKSWFELMRDEQDEIAVLFD